MRWLVGGLLAVVLVVGLVFAVTNLGSLFQCEPQSQPGSGNVRHRATPDVRARPPPAQSAPAAGPPAIEDITRQGDFDFAATYDVDLVQGVRRQRCKLLVRHGVRHGKLGRPGSRRCALFVKLKSPAKVSSITLTQLGGSGGNISV